MSEWIKYDGRMGRPAGLADADRVEWVNSNGTSGTTTAAWLGWDGPPPVVKYRIIPSIMAPAQEQPTHDPVNKPSHYMLFPEQGIEFIDVRDVLIERLKDFGPKQIDYWSRAFEYLARAGGKNGIEDIKKAKWYLDRLVASLEEQK